MRIKVIEYASKLVLTGDREALEKLKLHFRHRPESYWRSARYQIYLSTGGQQGWDGYLYPFRCSRGTWTAPRGRLDEVLAKAELEDYDVNLDDLFERPHAKITADDIPDNLLEADFDLDVHQRACVAALMSAQVGRVKVTVSGGKTEIFLACASMLRSRWPHYKVLYLTPTERLVNQVTKRAKAVLPQFKVTQMGGGKKDGTGDLVVATAAMLHRNLKDLDDWMRGFSVVFADECHYAVAPSWTAILEACPAIWRFGASDSMKVNSDTGKIDLQGLFGPVLHTVHTSDMIKLDRVAVPHVHALRIRDWEGKYDKTPFIANVDTTAWLYVNGEFKKVHYVRPTPSTDSEGNETDERSGLYEIRHPDGTLEDVPGKWLLMDRVIDKSIVRNKERNAIIAQIAAEFSGRGWPTLVVATRTLHCYLLNGLLQKALGNNHESLLQVLMGDATTAQRDATFEWFKETPGAVLLSPLVKVGVSINEIKAGIIADHVVDHEVFNQIVGRFIRKKKDTDVAHVVMFDDVQQHGMRKNSKELIQWAESADGYEVHRHFSVESCLQNLKT